jgi:hypothetical protein
MSISRHGSLIAKSSPTMHRNHAKGETSDVDFAREASIITGFGISIFHIRPVAGVIRD